jgi:hypothetical protein
LLHTPGVFVLDIERDLRDVVVSAYYHHVRLGRFLGSFGDSYWIEGRLIADRVTRYHPVWQQESPKDVLCASYEALHADFGCEVGRIAGFLGLELPQERLERVRERTSLERIRERRKEAKGNRPRFYRKGQTGEWQTHLTAPMLHDLARPAALQRGAAGWHAAQAAHTARLTALGWRPGSGSRTVCATPTDGFGSGSCRTPPDAAERVTAVRDRREAA